MMCEDEQKLKVLMEKRRQPLKIKISRSSKKEWETAAIKRNVQQLRAEAEKYKGCGRFN